MKKKILFLFAIPIFILMLVGCKGVEYDDLVVPSNADPMDSTSLEAILLEAKVNAKNINSIKVEGLSQSNESELYDKALSHLYNDYETTVQTTYKIYKNYVVKTTTNSSYTYDSELEGKRSYDAKRTFLSWFDIDDELSTTGNNVYSIFNKDTTVVNGATEVSYSKNANMATTETVYDEFNLQAMSPIKTYLSRDYYTGYKRKNNVYLSYTSESTSVLANPYYPNDNTKSINTYTANQTLITITKDNNSWYIKQIDTLSEKYIINDFEENILKERKVINKSNSSFTISYGERENYNDKLEYVEPDTTLSMIQYDNYSTSQVTSYNAFIDLSEFYYPNGINKIYALEFSPSSINYVYKLAITIKDEVKYYGYSNLTNSENDKKYISTDTSYQIEDNIKLQVYSRYRVLVELDSNNTLIRFEVTGII